MGAGNRSARGSELKIQCLVQNPVSVPTWDFVSFSVLIWRKEIGKSSFSISKPAVVSLRPDYPNVEEVGGAILQSWCKYTLSVFMDKNMFWEPLMQKIHVKSVLVCREFWA